MQITTIKKNIIASAFLKGVGLATSLAIVPLTLHYLQPEEYGIWLTMTSILSWFAFLDIGLGNGLRNYLTIAITQKDYAKARIYLATTFVILSGIAFLIFLLILLALEFIDLNRVFNTHALSGDMLKYSLVVAACFTLVTFVVKNIGFIFIALQRYALNDLLVVGGNLLALFCILILRTYAEGNLLYVVISYTVPPVMVFTLAVIPIFKRYPMLRFSLSDVNFPYVRDIIVKGLGFFVIQITSCLVVFGSANLFITQIAGPSHVTTFNIAYKYFNLLIIGFTILLSPLWNAYTDHAVRNDFRWIGNTYKKTLVYWLSSILLGIVMVLFSNIFYRLWVGHEIHIPWRLSWLVLFFVCCFNLNNCATYLINGLNKLSVQIITSIVSTVVYLAIMYLYEGKTVESVVFTMGAVYLAMAVVHLYQCRKLIQCKAVGIWNR